MKIIGEKFKMSTTDDFNNSKPYNSPNMLQIKILYWGPGEAGKTTNFIRLKEIFKRKLISKGFSIATSDERTLWNDSVHFKFTLNKMNIDLIVILSTTTGQERFLSTREYILQNSDGVVFVADSSEDKIDKNIRSFDELLSFTRENKIPILILLNKRDIPNAIGKEKFRELLNLPEIETDKNGCKIIYQSSANNKSNPGDVQQVFLDLIQKILKMKLIK